ncbi:DUF4407 domain-containing protein [Pseudofrankia sp. BMG5.37]|uniref:DUF4407 domain-containing protein n=1 Tax=Pseudofrankia sp. BMG5.37 TaxID=3050035 RepID=UPI0028946DBB|nr:DUF4407 domain-containing protein [Pseudofrankia sp. BMG5.37]MDT3439807.1 DUF4407 domain-containing protein [Pseudofrankia sp. BMG5.37]
MDSGGERLRGGELVDGASGSRVPSGHDGEAGRHETDRYEDGHYEDGLYAADQEDALYGANQEDGLYEASRQEANRPAPDSFVTKRYEPDRRREADGPAFDSGLAEPTASRAPRRPLASVRRTAANLLIGCTGADHRTVTERDRSRFTSAGALMLLTAALAAYAGASVAAFGFGTSTLAALPYGVFYAAFIFFIDRSVLLTIRPLRVKGKGDKEDIRPRRWLPTGAIRVFIAVCGAILVGESLLLRFFDSSIEPRVAELRQEELSGVLAAWDESQHTAEARLTADLADRRAQLTAAENLVTSKTGEVNCQLTGGDGCLGGRGPVYQVKLGELRAAAAQVPKLRTERDAAQTRLDAFRTSRDQRRAQYADAQWTQIRGSNDLLMREKGFWRLTADDNSVKAWRVLLSLLILGIDLAPLLFKRSLDRTSYARAERAALWGGETNEFVDAYQLNRNARARRGRAGDVAEHMAARYEEYALAREELRLATSLDDDTAEASLRREERWLGHERQAADLRRAHRLPATVPSPAAPPASPPAAVPTETTSTDDAGSPGPPGVPASRRRHDAEDAGEA